MKIINKIKLKNFKRFRCSQIEFNNDLNVIVGDNESGKSSILQAIDMVISGSTTKIKNIGLEYLFNIHAIEDFMEGDKSYGNLPVLIVELYLNEQNNYHLNGRNNTDNVECDGLVLTCEPNDEYSAEIEEILQQNDVCFPFEYFKIGFKTFAGEGYTGYRKFLKKITLDNSSMSNEYAAREYIKDVYTKNVTLQQKAKYANEYRRHKHNFVDTVLNEVNEELEEYKFDIKTDTKSNLGNDLSIKEGDIPISNMGQGKQCFIKTKFALASGNPHNDIDTLLLEEPENHLSHINMHKLVNEIRSAHSKQMFITTHNSMIASRLNLRRIIMLSSNVEVASDLRVIPEDTAKFFMKAPNNNLLAYILSKKVILVEGDAEYILMELFFKKVTDSELSDRDVHVISVGGTSFKRYLDLGNELGIKTAVIRDNDHNFQNNCVDLYSEYVNDKTKIFGDTDNANYTFEVNLYNSNSHQCDELFGAGRRTLTVLDYMLKNKADVAYELLDKKADELIVPDYIKEAINWIND